MYRARDTRLGRDVALKVLPDLFAADPERLARFGREAQVLASLNHPHIAAIHGLEERDGVRALVLELVEGETLAERIARGPIPHEEALPIAREICDGLEAAHEQGIIHCDLKPANIKITPQGVVKVLDFGLAKAMEGTPTPDLSMSPTITSPTMMTGVGVLLGTAAYMSPEQAKGRPADKRSDVWAFGCALFEMLTGTRAFEGEDITDVLAAVVRAEPAWQRLPSDTPQSIRRLLQRCLVKDRRERLPDIGSARLEIKDALTAQTEDVKTAAPSRSRVFTSAGAAWSVALVAIVLAGGAAIGAARYLRENQPVAKLVRFQVPPSDGESFGTGNAPAMAISPDGTQIAYVSVTADGKRQMWLRRIDAVKATPLPGTEGAANPIWSPDSRSIAFLADTQLKRLDLAGGPPQIICAIPGAPLAVGGVSTGTWSRNNTIVFFATGTSGLYRVPANGGTPVTATTLDQAKGESLHTWPHFLPDGRHFIYWANRGTELVSSLDSTAPIEILTTEFAADFALPNYLLFRRGSALFAQTFNLRTFQLEGEPVRIEDPVGSFTAQGRPGFSVSENGSLLFWPISASAQAGDENLAIHDSDGRIATTTGNSSYRGVDLSPDGTHVATHLHEAGSGGGDVWLLDLARGTRQRFTFDASQENSSPIWSPDGMRIAYASLRGGKWGLYAKPSGGVGQEALLFESPSPKAPLSYSPDGMSLVFENDDAKTKDDLWLLRLDGRRSPEPLVQSPFDDNDGQISPDGRWLAYASNESGRGEVYVQGLSNNTARWQVSTAGGFSPRWKRDGNELYFVRGAQMLAVDVDAAGNGLRFGIPKVAFQFAPRLPTHINPYLSFAVDARGQRFITMEAPSTGSTAAADTPLTVVLNWPSALQK